uniref:Ig-like domain-containing protein n=1 Tax=Monopterus albus TaxID=43700 RepID=A0A3Q3Q8E3_MONAL|nr:factor XIIa inhibitor-like [Monopterus albus]XP_020457778.1 factor XIIa inhibitor-like [Monopterus albus]
MRPQAILCLLLQLIFELSSCTQLRVLSGSTLELPCISFKTDVREDAITWTFNGKNIRRQPPVNTRVEKNGELIISPVTAANKGDYVCLFKEENMVMHRMYSITVDASIGYTIRVATGSDEIKLPCHFPPGSQVTDAALWFKEKGSDNRAQLSPDDSTGKVGLEQLDPHDSDQTISLRNIVKEDAGIYHCETADGEPLSTVNVIVEDPYIPKPHSCANTIAWEPCLDENSRTGEPMLQESVTEFSMKLYSSFKKSLPSGNLLFSPISISSILSHLLLGARDETRESIEDAVSVPHDFHCVHFQMKKLREKLASSLQMASQIYYNPQLNVSESFINQSIQFYDAEPTRLLNTSEKNTWMVNQWVASKTKNKIKHLVDFVSPSTQLILLNAVSFNGQWKVKFEPKSHKEHFVKLNGDTVKVPILYHQKYMATMTYAVSLMAQVARFALTGDSSLYILLPRTNTLTDLQQVENRMTDTAVREMIELMNKTHPQHIEVTLPQIKIDAQPNMNMLLGDLGLKSLFERPNLCGLISKESVVLSEAKHRAYLALTEQGVEAGAVTSMVFSRSFPSFTALRPFIMLLWSDQANVPLFMGRVTEP